MFPRSFTDIPDQTTPLENYQRYNMLSCSTVLLPVTTKDFAQMDIDLYFESLSTAVQIACHASSQMFQSQLRLYSRKC